MKLDFIHILEREINKHTFIVFKIHCITTRVHKFYYYTQFTKSIIFDFYVQHFLSLSLFFWFQIINFIFSRWYTMLSWQARDKTRVNQRKCTYVNSGTMRRTIRYFQSGAEYYLQDGENRRKGGVESAAERELSILPSSFTCSFPARAINAETIMHLRQMSS